MRLTDYLSKAGYDLVDGPIRNHKPLQLWLKQGFNRPELYYDNIGHAFFSNVQLEIKEDTALSVDGSKKQTHAFNIGITLLDNVLKSIGLSSLEISAKIKQGKKVSISYKNAVTKSVTLGAVAEYFTKADFLHVNPILLSNANQNNLLLITGVVFAQQLVVDIDTTLAVDNKWMTSIKKELKGKIDISVDKQEKLKMVTSAKDYFPIAVKASRLYFDKGQFKGLLQVTDNRNFF